MDSIIKKIKAITKKTKKEGPLFIIKYIKKIFVAGLVLALILGIYKFYISAYKPTRATYDAKVEGRSIDTEGLEEALNLIQKDRQFPSVSGNPFVK